MNRPFPCNSSNNVEAMLRRIQEIDFSIYDTILYLDAYPDCSEALGYYHTLIAERKSLVAQYEREAGPLSAFSNASRTSWDWVRSPWPWQA